MSQDLPIAPEPTEPRAPVPSPQDHDGRLPGPPASVDRVSVTAFVFSLLGAGLVAIPLGVWGLVRTRSGPRRGRGFAIAALGVSAAWAVASVAVLSYGLLGSPAGPAGTAAAHRAPASNVTAPAAPSPSTSTATQAPVVAQPTGPLTKARRFYWEDLRPGMCVRIPQDPAATYVTVVDCRSAHESEVMARTVLAGPKKWPGDSAVSNAAEERCRPAFEAYVGISFDDSRLEVDFLTTDPAGWRAGDHTLVCFVLDPTDGHVNQALRGIRE